MTAVGACRRVLGLLGLLAVLGTAALAEATPTPVANCAQDCDAKSLQYACYNTTVSLGACPQGCADSFDAVANVTCGSGSGCQCTTCCVVSSWCECAECAPGFLLTADRRYCEDVNECSAGTPCQGGRPCTNTVGAYTCGACPSGYATSSATTCTACPANRWGTNCTQPCTCGTHGTCNVADGSCNCASGWTGVSCQSAVCGDGVVQVDLALNVTEECDDGTAYTTTGCCTNECRYRPAGTSCTSDLNACTVDVCKGSGNCTHATSACTCGNGVIDSNETCDAGPTMTGLCPYGFRSCVLCLPNTCVIGQGTASFLGDGVTDPANGEECDDGNAASGDGCDSSGHVEAGFVCSINATDPSSTTRSACVQCSSGWWGASCRKPCSQTCYNGGSCSAVTGACVCTAEFSGPTCLVVVNRLITDAFEITGAWPQTMQIGTQPQLAFNSSSTTALSTAAVRPLRSATTAIAYGPGSCGPATALRGVTRYLADPAPVTLAVPFGALEAGDYVVCISYDLAPDASAQDELAAAVAAATWTQTAAPTVAVVAPPLLSTAITSLSPTTVALGTSPVLTVGATSAYSPSAATVFALAPNASACTTGPRYWTTPVPAGTGTTLTLGAMLAPSGNGTATAPPVQATILTACLSTDSGTSYVAQTAAQVFVAVLSPDAGLIAAVSPTWLTASSTTVPLTFTTANTTSVAALASAGAMYALLPYTTNGGADGCTNASALAAVTAVGASALASAVTVPGVYALCVRAAASAAWVRQTTSGVAVTVRAPAATATAITALSPASGDTAAAWTVAVTGAVPSDSTYLGFLANTTTTTTTCETLSALANGTTSTAAIASALVALTRMPPGAGTVVTLAARFLVTGTYALCYTTDGILGPWATQSIVGVAVGAPAATKTTITALTPSTLTLPGGTVAFSGAVPSATTVIALVPVAATANLTLAPDTICSSGSVVLGPWALRDTGTTTATVNDTRLMATSPYAVCYSTTAGASWTLQTGVLLTVLAPTPGPTTVTAAVATTLVAGSLGATQAITLTGVVPSPSTWIALALATTPASSPCPGANETLQAVTLVADAVPSAIPLASAVTVGGLYQVCVSTTAGQTWVRQTEVVLTLAPPSATATSVTALLPSTITEGAATALWQLQGAVPSPWTRLAFVASSSTVAADCADTEKRWLLTTYDAATTVATVDGIPVGTYRLCYSVDSGASWALQAVTAATTLTVVLLNPPPATTVTALAAAAGCPGLADSDASIAADATDVLPLDTACNFTVHGAVPSAGTMLRLQLIDAGAGQSALPLCTVVTSNTLTFALAASVTVAWTADQAAAVVAGTYTVCYATDGGSTWVQQTAVGSGSGTVWLRPPAATAAALTAATPSPVTVNADIDRVQTLQLVGLAPSSTSYVAFVLAIGGNCSRPADYLGQAGSSPLLLAATASSAITVTGAFTTLAPRALCYSTRGPSAANMVRQTAILGVVAATALAYDISAITPSAVVAGRAAQSVTLTGGLHSASSLIGFAPFSNGVCTTAGMVATAVFNASTVTIAPPLHAVTRYLVCYSVNGGATWQVQLLFFSAVLPSATATTLPTLNLESVYAGHSFTLSIAALVDSVVTELRFVKDAAGTDACGAIGAADTSTVQTIYYTAPATEARFGLPATGWWSTCVSYDDGASYVLQTSPDARVFVLPWPASTTSVTAVSPPVITLNANSSELGVVAGLTLVGATPSNSTAVALTRTNCTDNERLFETFLDETISINTTITQAGTYAVCYSTDGGTTWMQQALASFVVLDPSSGTGGGGGGTTTAADAAIPAALIGVGVAALVAIVLLVAAAILLVRYRRHSKQLAVFNRFFGSADVLNEPAFMSANPLFQDSNAYQARLADPLAAYDTSM